MYENHPELWATYGADILLIIHCKKTHLEYDFWRQINHYFLIFVLLLILTSLRGNTVKLLLHRT